MVATSTPAVPSPPAPAAAASAAPGLSGSAAAPAPCRTLYVRNLCEKPKKEKLRVLLHALFSPYGEIEWISAQKTIKLRGQAFITFRDIAGATAALRRLQGASFLSRPLRIFYARSESDRAVAPGAARGAARKARKTRPRPRVPAPDAPAPPPQEMPVAMEEAEPDVPQNTPPVQPNRVLFAQQTPPGGALAERCARLAGFVEVRSAPGKPGIAFVEFNTEANAAVAVAALDGVVLVEGTPPLQIAYAKK